eukprot:TRINITY_DN2755_c0_g1_i1.p1 TRINITY_DN2755_c0_g1~~TRINITY_DN2755_c0_g1_i1.p1  ORF type:complete len:1060 (+),score=174.09 TRINITY_DN2755_c0_g1_i1:1065-4244(+)
MFPVTYINPASGNINVIGFDLQSHPDRVEYVRKALRGDTTYTTTAPIELVQSTDTEKGKAFLVMRSAALDGEIKGLISAVLRVADVVSRAHSGTENVFAVKIFDVTDMSEKEMNDPSESYGELMFDELSLAYHPPLEDPVYRIIDVDNRKWRIAMYPYRHGLDKFLSATPGVVLGSSMAFIAVVGCLIALTIYYMTKLEQLSKQLEVQFKRAEQSRDEANEGARWNDWFLAHMSHEIRSPLNGIIGLLSILPNQDDPHSKRENLMGREELMSYIAVLQRSTKGLKVVLDDILTVCKGKANIETREGSYNVRDLVAGVNQISASSVRGKLDVLMFVAREVPELVLGDEARLRQVLLNLLSNAVNFTPEGEISVLVELVDSLEVTTAVSVSSDTIFTRLHLLPNSRSNVGSRPVGIRFSVVDSGCGIPSEQVKIIFDAFVQGDASTTRRHQGTGLGLTIANYLVSYMGGSITCHSVVGVGTEFSFVIPLKEAPKPSSPSVSGSAAAVDVGGPSRKLSSGSVPDVSAGHTSASGVNKAGGNGASGSSATTVTTIATADGSRPSPKLRARSDRSDQSLSTEHSLSQALLQARASKDLGSSLGNDKVEPTVWAIDPHETSRLFIKHLLPKGTCQSYRPQDALVKLKDSNGMVCPNAFLVTALNWDRDVDMSLDSYLMDLVRSTRGRAGGVLICIPFRAIVSSTLIPDLQEIHPLLPIKFLPWPLWYRDLTTTLAEFSRVHVQLSEPLSRGSTSTLWSTTVPKLNSEAVQNMVRDVVAGSHKPAGGLGDNLRQRDNDNESPSPAHVSSSTMHSAPLRLRGLPPRPAPSSPSGSLRGSAQTMSHLGARLHQLHGEGSVSQKSGRSGNSGGAGNKGPLVHLGHHAGGKGSQRKRLLKMRTLPLPLAFPDASGRGSTGGSPSSQHTGDREDNGFDGLTVLVIEDQTVNQLVLCMHLRAAGHRCLVANDGDVGARTYIENHKDVDVCLIDYHMPVVDGLGCARRIRGYEKRQGWPPTLLYSLTADTRPQTAELIKEAGFSHMMLKPLDFQQLMKELEAVKEKKRLRNGT